jgi:hypothetical protein
LELVLVQPVTAYQSTQLTMGTLIFFNENAQVVLYGKATPGPLLQLGSRGLGYRIYLIEAWAYKLLNPAP